MKFSGRNIALSCSVSKNTVSKVIKTAEEIDLAWPLDDSQTDKVLEETLFSKDASSNTIIGNHSLFMLLGHPSR